MWDNTEGISLRPYLFHRNTINSSNKRGSCISIFFFFLQLVLEFPSENSVYWPMVNSASFPVNVLSLWCGRTEVCLLFYLFYIHHLPHGDLTNTPRTKISSVVTDFKIPMNAPSTEAGGQTVRVKTTTYLPGTLFLAK